TRSCSFRLHAGALDFSRRQLYRTVVAVLALIDGDVIHPHRILFRHRRGVRQSHRVAVILDLARTLRRRGRLGRLIEIETDIAANGHRDIVAAVRRLLRRQRIERLAVRIPVVERRSRPLGGRGRCERELRLALTDEVPAGTACRRRERGGSGDYEDSAAHFCAVMTSLLSTVPVSPCTLAP